jgi:hypothetical protein
MMTSSFPNLLIAGPPTPTALDIVTVIIAGFALLLSLSLGALQWWQARHRRPRFDADTTWVMDSHLTPALRFTISNVGFAPGSVRRIGIATSDMQEREFWVPDELESFEPFWLQVYETSSGFTVRSTYLVDSLRAAREHFLSIEDARGKERRFPIPTPMN